ncbi:GNAT family N-acetyltransferase [Isoptericola jiangsuensis]|uniref:GNAT family N-acetyltransferase n=1 Tax=Isoptericola jiangsuensis TaxID=548579 RepID=UPI003AAC2F19
MAHATLDGVLIREREAADLHRLVEILRTTHLRDAYPFRPEAAAPGWLVRHSGPSWVLTVDDVVVGHVALDRSDPQRGAEIVRYFLAPQARGTGGASMLLRHALHHAIPDGRDPWLVVMPHNVAAIAVYESAGFVPDGEGGWTDPDGTWHRVLRYRFSGPVEGQGVVDAPSAPSAPSAGGRPPAGAGPGQVAGRTG